VGNTDIPVFLPSAREDPDMQKDENVWDVHNGGNRPSLRL